MTSDKSASGSGARRRYSAELQAQVMTKFDAPGASGAKVAMPHGVNANGGHRWRQLAREARPALATSTGEFVPVSLPPRSPATGVPDINIRLRRGTTKMTITWPVSAAADFGAWMRELPW